MKTTLLVLGAAALVPVAAHAQGGSFITQDAGWYWSADVGGTVAQDGHVTQFGRYSTGQSVSYGAGVGMDLAGGFAFNRYFSLEGQVGWTWNPINSIGEGSLEDTSLSTLPIMANAVFKFPLPHTRIVPYVGAGAGGAVTFFDTDGYTRYTSRGSVTLYGTSSDFVFAWQAFAGVRWELNDKMSVGIGYRYLALNGSNFSFDSDYYGGPTVNLGISGLQSHLAAITFNMKF